MTTLQMSFLRQRDYLAAAMTHFFVDVLNSARNLLVALLAVSIGLTNAQVGIALMVYNIGNALSQPLFGWLADRIGPRWLVVGGIGWMICFSSLAALAGDWPALIAITMVGLGSGSFHPSGTLVASQITEQFRNRATAVFFMAGQMGLFVGPVLAGFVLEWFDRPGYLILPALAFVALASSWRWISERHAYVDAAADDPASPHAHAHPHTAPQPVKATAPASRLRWSRFIPLAILLVSQSSIGITAITFVPVLFTELGYAIDYVGWLAGLFMMGSAFGGVLGGALADRFNGRAVIFSAMLAAVLPIYFYIPAGGAWRIVLLLVAGFFVGMPHSILILFVQSLLPRRKAMASGMALGLMFFGGSVGSYAAGLIADQIGLAATLQGVAILPIVSAVMVLLLPGRGRPKPRPAEIAGSVKREA